MTEWGVFCVIVSILGLIVSVLALVKPVYDMKTSIAVLKHSIASIGSLTDTVTKVNVALIKLDARQETTEKALSDYRDDNAKSHKRLWDKNEIQDAKLADHDKRIHALECRKGV